MKIYTVQRSIFGELGSLKRNQTLSEIDPRIVNNTRAVSDLVKRKLLVEGTDDAEPKAKPAKGKRQRGEDHEEN